MRIVIDTNVVVSAILKGGLSQAVLNTVIYDHATWLVSREILIEYEEVLSRKKFGLPFTLQKQWHDVFKQYGLIVFPNQKELLPNDPKDEKFLECAIAGKARCIVSGDKKHLLPLKMFLEIPIVSPMEFLELRQK